MRDLRDLKKEEEGPGSKKAQPILIISILGLFVFLALLLFFRGGRQSAPPPSPAPVSPPPQESPAAKSAPEGGEEAVVKDPTLQPGEMRFGVKKEEMNPPPVAQQAPGAALPKEDLTFFKTLKGKNGKENKIALKPKKISPPAARSKVSTPPRTAAPAASLYTIQVASFIESKGADALAKKLKENGFESYVTTAELPDKGKRYRVRVGHYATRLEAEKIAGRLHETEKLSFFIAPDKGK